MELSVYEYLDEINETKSTKRIIDSIANRDLVYEFDSNDPISDLNCLRANLSSPAKRSKTNGSISPIDHLNSSANCSTIVGRSKENRQFRHLTSDQQQQHKSAFSQQTFDNHLNQINQLNHTNQLEQLNASKMLNGMMLASNLISHTNQMNGDVAASSFSPNTLTGNSMNSSNNTISGLSPSSSYDSFSPRCKFLLFKFFLFDSIEMLSTKLLI